MLRLELRSGGTQLRGHGRHCQVARCCAPLRLAATIPPRFAFWWAATHAGLHAGGCGRKNSSCGLSRSRCASVRASSSRWMPGCAEGAPDWEHVCVPGGGGRGAKAAACDVSPLRAHSWKLTTFLKGVQDFLSQTLLSADLAALEPLSGREGTRLRRCSFDFCCECYWQLKSRAK